MMNEAATTAVRNKPAGDAHVLLRAELSACRRHLTWGLLGSRLVGWIAAAICVPLMIVVADHVWPGGLPRPVIAGAGLSWLAAAVVGIAVLAARTLRIRWNRMYLARHLERAGAIRHNPLVNTLMVANDHDAEYAVEGVSRQAARALRGFDAARGIEPDVMRRPLRVLLAATAAWALYLAIAPKPVLPSLARLFGAGLAAPTATRLELIRPRADEVVHAGDELAIEIAAAGRPIEQLFFELLDPAAPTEEPRFRYPASRRIVDGRPLWRLTLSPHEVIEDLHYRCAAGDARLQGVIAVQPRPDVVGFDIEIVPPAYTGLAARRTSDPELRVWAGSRVTIAFRANADVTKPVFVLSGEGQTRTRMSVDAAEPRRAGVTMTMRASGTYWVEFTDPWNYPYRESAQHSISVRDDGSPTVEIVAPTPEQAPGDVVDVDHVLQLAAQARDDVHVEQVLLIAEREQERKQTVLVSAAEGDALRKRVVARVSTADFELAPGESVRVWFEARDRRVLPDGTVAGLTATSRVLTLVRKERTAAESSAAGGERTEGRRTSEPEAGESDEAGEQTGQREGQSGDEAESGAGEDTNPSAESTDEPAPVGGAKADSGAGEPGGESEEGLEEALRRFLEEHGEEAREAGQELGESEGGEEAEKGEGREESERGEGGEEAEKGEESERGEGGEESEKGEEGEESPTSQPSESKSETPSPKGDQPSQSKGGAEEPNQPSESEPSDEGEPKPGETESQTHGADCHCSQCSSEGTAGKEQGQGAPPDSKAESSSGGSEPTGDDPELPPDHPQSDPPAAPDQKAQAPESTGRAELLDLLKLLERRDELSAERLVAAGWTPERAAAFLKALDRLHDEARVAGAAEQLRRLIDARPLGAKELQRGRGRADRVGTGVAGGQRSGDGLEKIAPPAEQRVPRALQAILDAYYRSLAERRATEQDRRP